MATLILFPSVSCSKVGSPVVEVVDGTTGCSGTFKSSNWSAVVLVSPFESAATVEATSVMLKRLSGSLGSDDWEDVKDFDVTNLCRRSLFCFRLSISFCKENLILSCRTRKLKI